MSQASRERHSARKAYFAYLRQTAELVDPYVQAHIEKQFGQLSWLRDLLLRQYRFGKPQLRPATVRMAYELAGGDDWQRIVSACAAVEAKDTGYYCFDQMLDISGISSSLLMAGHCFQEMVRTMLDDLDYTKEQMSAIRCLFHGLDLANMDGVRIENEMAKTHSMNLEMYFQKAAGYNFWEYAFGIGAVLAGASSERVDLIKRIGRLIGMAYIVANDAWEFGKDYLQDFQSGKMTLPIIYALQNADLADMITLKACHGRGLTVGLQDEIRQIMVKCGAIDYGKQNAKELCQQALNLLREFEDSRVRQMIEFSTTTTQRNRYFDKLDTYR